jgi:hypothetical protein
MAAVMLLRWVIWTARNDKIFKGIQPSLRASKKPLLQGTYVVMPESCQNLATMLVDQWTQNLV